MDVLPTPYFNHYCLFVKAIHVLLSDNIRPNDLNNCEEWLKDFYKKFEELYSKHEYVLWSQEVETRNVMGGRKS